MNIKIGDTVKHACGNANCDLRGLVESINGENINVRISSFATIMGFASAFEVIEKAPSVEPKSESLEYLRGRAETMQSLFELTAFKATRQQTVSEILATLEHLAYQAKKEFDAAVNEQGKAEPSPISPEEVNETFDSFLGFLAAIAASIKTDKKS